MGNKALELARRMAAEAVQDCMDANLLDLVWKLLITAKPGPGIGGTEGEKSERNKGHKEEHGTVTGQILRPVEHSGKDAAEMGAGGKGVPGVRRGADRVQGAA